ncbi:MAG: glucose-6-phosphate isomerase, partial [Tolypothrix sp. T3-bin4]|nr:glucose-6-phosphate isomerase [Tolypothrix sp. T3-bin4]
EVLEDRLGTSPEVEPGVTSGDYLSGLLQGTRQALYENQRDSITVTIPRVTPRTVGALIALYDRAVGFYGFLVNVNAYHQPGVEAGKKAAAAILDLQKRVMQVLEDENSAIALSDLAQKAGASDQVEAVYKLLRHLQSNKRGVVLEGDLGKPSSLMVSAS